MVLLWLDRLALGHHPADRGAVDVAAEEGHAELALLGELLASGDEPVALLCIGQRFRLQTESDRSSPSCGSAHTLRARQPSKHWDRVLVVTVAARRSSAAEHQPKSSVTHSLQSSKSSAELSNLRGCQSAPLHEEADAAHLFLKPGRRPIVARNMAGLILLSSRRSMNTCERSHQ